LQSELHFEEGLSAHLKSSLKEKTFRDCFLKPFESEMKAGFLAKNHRIWAKLLDSLGYQQANDSKNRLKKHSLRVFVGSYE
jgi:hypothetical protein